MGILTNVLKSIFRGPALAGESVTVTTSMHHAGYEEYGRRFIETFEPSWPDNYRLRIYAEGFALQPGSARASVLDLLQAVPDVAEFRARFADRPQAQGRITSRNISPGRMIHPIANSILGQYIDHLKGPDRKKAGASLARDRKF